MLEYQITADEYHEAVKNWGLTQRDAEIIFTGHDNRGRTSRRWSSGEFPVPYAVGLLIRVMISQGWTAADLEARL